jgi:hypothetical protein
MYIKQLGFDSVITEFSIADVVVELLGAKKAFNASVLRFASAGAIGAAA